MGKLLRICAIGSLILFGSVASAYGSGLALAQNHGIAFGVFALAGAAGSLTISPSGAVTATNLVLVSQGSSGRTAASFTVTGGEANQAFTIILPTTDVIIQSGGSTMTVSNFTSSCAGNSGQFDATGACTFTVGATLSVAQNQASGGYSGSFSVDIETSMTFSVIVQ